MILVADGGSTKCDWALIDRQRHVQSRFETTGLNPYYLSESELYAALKVNSSINSVKNEVTEIHFYGAGCSDELQIKKLRKTFTGFFPQLSKVFISNDLNGAILATCNNQIGICGILGTGSNACYFNGQNIEKKTHSLGLYFGDEGSGGYFGKMLCKHFFYNQLPEDLAYLFVQKYALKKDEFLDRIYNQPKPNTYLATFFPFVVENKNHPFVAELIANGLKSFVGNHISVYPKVPVHFVGSVAYELHPFLSEVLHTFGYSLGTVVRHPLEGMIKHIKLD
ncbi:MAG: N-acetylglucosamine kinase [Flavobacteriales bacterium]|nr:N-acetylglucosamine kinase [Flavobacteriales bacterium]